MTVLYQSNGSCEKSHDATEQIKITSDRPNDVIDPPAGSRSIRQLNVDTHSTDRPGPRISEISEGLANEKTESWNFGLRQKLTILGAGLLLFPHCTRWLWGNLVVYTSSYFYVHGHYDAVEVTNPWILPIYMMSWSLGLFAMGPIVKCFGQRGALFVGILFFDIGIFLSFLSVTFTSAKAMNVTLGAITGFGDGLTENVIVLILTEWTSKRRGITMTLVFSCLVFGGSIINQIATWFINPANLKPALKVGSSKFFTQSSVLERTPPFLLIYLAFSVFFHTLGFVLIRSRNADSKSKCCSLFSRCFNSDKDPKDSTEKRQNVQSAHDDSSTTDKELGDSTEDDDEGKSSPKSPLRLLLMPTFHTIWFGLTCTEIAKVWLFEYYKIFGLLYISDDHFLTDLSTFMTIGGGISRIMWGLVLDLIGFKSSVVAVSASISIVTAFFFIAPHVGPWMYAFASMLFASTVVSYAALAPISVISLYGKASFSLNYGLMWVFCIAFSLLAPFMFQGFIDNLGWFPLLITLSLLNAVALVLQILFLPQISTYKKN